MSAKILHINSEQGNSPVTPSYAEAVIALMHSVLERRSDIEAALEYTEGTHTFDDIAQMVLSGRLYWIPMPNSFICMEIVEYPRAKHFHGFLAGGKLEEIRDKQDYITYLASQAGCSMVTLSGRRGWVKALADLGWQESHTTIFLPVPTPSHSEHEHG